MATNYLPFATRRRPIASADITLGDGTFGNPDVLPAMPAQAPARPDLAGLIANQPSYGRPLQQGPTGAPPSPRFRAEGGREFLGGTRGARTRSEMEGRIRTMAMLNQLYGRPQPPQTGLEKRLRSEGQMASLDALLPQQLGPEGDVLPTQERIRIESQGQTYTPRGFSPEGERDILPRGARQQRIVPGSDEHSAAMIERQTQMKNEALAQLDSDVRAGRISEEDADRVRREIEDQWYQELYPYTGRLPPRRDDLSALIPGG